MSNYIDMHVNFGLSKLLQLIHLTCVCFSWSGVPGSQSTALSSALQTPEARRTPNRWWAASCESTAPCVHAYRIYYVCVSVCMIFTLTHAELEYLYLTCYYVPAVWFWKGCTKETRQKDLKRLKWRNGRSWVMTLSCLQLVHINDFKRIVILKKCLNSFVCST